VPTLTSSTDLYNAGCEALSSGNLGEAVLFLRAASRLEPRARDVARNLSITEARVALARGENGGSVSGHGPLVIGLASGESWLLASLLIALGAAGRAWRWRRLGRIGTSGPGAGGSTRFGRLFLGAAGLAGLAMAAWLLAGAVVERVLPEAVVLEHSLPLTAASGQPLPEAPALVEGEVVRLGTEREGLVEIKLGGTSVGWARRSGVWRVTDAPRYTLSSSREGKVRLGERTRSPHG
jgi:hypothetical protein